MNRWEQKQTGFTIVELLIVVIVIAILATITIVSFNNIQNRAHDSAVQSDLAAAVKKLHQYKAENSADRYPTALSELESIGLRFSKGSYALGDTVRLNIAYCTQTNGTGFALLAMSKSGARYAFTESAKPTVPSAWVWDTTVSNLSGFCQSSQIGSYSQALSHGYASTDTPPNGPWRAWAGGN